MNKLILLLAMLAIGACGTEKKEDQSSAKKKKEEKSQPESILSLKDLNFMEGNWIDASGAMPGFNEKWVLLNDSLFQVIGYFATEKDTSIMEAIKVKMVDGILNYIPKIENQNEEAEISYALQDWSTKDSIVFGNYKHNFPQEIAYVRKTNDSVVVYLKGIGEDKKPKEYLLQLKRGE